MLPWILAFSLSAAPMEESDPGTAAPSAVSPDYSADVQLITQQISKQYQSELQPLCGKRDLVCRTPLPPQGQGETWPYQTRSVGTGGSKPDLS